MAKSRFEHNKHLSLHFIIITSALQGIFLLWAAILYNALYAAFDWHGWLLGIVIVLLSTTFLSATVIARKFGNGFTAAYYWLAAYWFACMGCFFGSATLFVILQDIGPHVGISISNLVAGEISFGLGILLILYGTWQSQRVQITRRMIELPNLPDHWKGKRLLFVSDPHFGAVRRSRFAKKIVRKIESVSPEAVLIGGDMYDGLKCDEKKLVAPFADLKTPLGIFYVSGNHEYLGNANVFFDAIRSAGIKILHNEMVDLNGIQLIGVDYQDTERKENLAKILSEFSIDRSRPSIIIKHIPDNLDVSDAQGISLHLSGHTHQGQFWPLTYLAQRLFEGYHYGLKKYRNMLVLTSSGAGTWAIPFRLGTKSEIVELTLK